MSVLPSVLRALSLLAAGAAGPTADMPNPEARMLVANPAAVFFNGAKSSLPLGSYLSVETNAQLLPEAPTTPKGKWWAVHTCTNEAGFIRKGDVQVLNGRPLPQVVSEIINKLKDRPVKSSRYWAELMDFAEQAILNTPADVPVAPLQLVRMQAFIKVLKYLPDDEDDPKWQPKPEDVPPAFWRTRAPLFIENDYGSKMIDPEPVWALERPLRGTEEGDELMWIAAQPSYTSDYVGGMLPESHRRYLAAYPEGRHVNEILALTQKSCDTGQDVGASKDPSPEQVKADLQATAAALQGLSAEKFPLVATLRKCIAAFKLKR